MEDYIKIEQYVCCNADTKIVKKRKSPVVALLTLFVGIILIAFSMQVHLNEMFITLFFSIGVMTALVGGVLVLLACGKDSGTFVFSPTQSPMKMYSKYINTEDKKRCQECLTSGNMDALLHVRKEVSTSTMLRVLISKDSSCALMQMEEYVPHNFVPSSPVLMITNDEVKKLKRFLTNR